MSNSRVKKDSVNVSAFFRALEETIFPSDILTATLLMYTRNFTLTSGDWFYQETRNRQESFWKEVGASQGIREPSQINFEAMFGVEPNLPVCDFIPPNPTLQSRIHRDLCRWKEKCSKALFVPKTSRKSMGVLASYEAIKAFDLRLDFGSKLSTEDIEFWYWRTGEYPRGPCEMRQAWFYNDLTPRTYYATGSGVHRWARFSQKIFNMLLDQFPFTHRFKRFNLDRIRLEPWETAIVYDYTSFTSRLNEHIPFMRALARFCKGTTIRLLDGPFGVVEMDLGEYLDLYASECMELVEFTVSPELAEIIGVEALESLRHQVASLLGINGNLASATGLHGLFLCHLCGSYEKCSCVGDDAIGVFECRVSQGEEEGEIIEGKEECRQNFVRALRILGIVHSEKSKFFRPLPAYTNLDHIESTDRWTYLKRSLDRYPNFLQLGFLPAIPNLQTVIQEQNTTRRMNFDATDDSLMIPRVSSQCYNLVQSHFTLSAFGYEELESSFLILQTIYRRYRLPYGGWIFMMEQGAFQSLKHLEHVTFLPAIGKNLEEFSFLVRSHPIDNLSKLLLSCSGEDEAITVPVVVEKPYLSETPDSLSFRSTGSAVANYGVKVGVMTREAVTTEISSSEVHWYLKRFTSKYTSNLYEYKISPDCPEWFVDLLREI